MIGRVVNYGLLIRKNYNKCTIRLDIKTDVMAINLALGCQTTSKFVSGCNWRYFYCCCYKECFVRYHYSV